MHEAGLATLLFDLLSPDEALERANVFDVELLAVRLLAATRGLDGNPLAMVCRSGISGPVPGRAPHCGPRAKTRRSPRSCPVEAVPTLPPSSPRRCVTDLVHCRGRRHGRAPAQRRSGYALFCEHRLAIVPGATHLFEEPGTLEAAADAAQDWFVEHLSGVPAGR